MFFKYIELKSSRPSTVDFLSDPRQRVPLLKHTCKQGDQPTYWPSKASGCVTRGEFPGN